MNCITPLLISRSAADFRVALCLEPTATDKKYFNLGFAENVEKEKEKQERKEKEKHLASASSASVSSSSSSAAELGANSSVDLEKSSADRLSQRERKCVTN